jgi:hypothetical protein
MKRTNGFIGITFDRSKGRVYCTTKFIKKGTKLGISPKNPNVLLDYLDDIHSHLKKVMHFKPRRVDEACMQAQCLKNMENKKGK